MGKGTNMFCAPPAGAHQVGGKEDQNEGGGAMVVDDEHGKVGEDGNAIVLAGEEGKEGEEGKAGEEGEAAKEDKAFPQIKEIKEDLHVNLELDCITMYEDGDPTKEHFTTTTTTITS